MCVPYRQLDSKARRRVAIGSLCLALGLLLPRIVHPTGELEQDWLHGICGMFLGVSIGVNLFSLRFARGCGKPQT
jgi:hypothetical protein